MQGSSYRYRRFFRFVSWRLDRVSLPWLAAGERNTVSVGDALLGGSFRLGSSAFESNKCPLPLAGGMDSTGVNQLRRAALMRLRSFRLKPKAAPAPRMGRGPGV